MVFIGSKCTRTILRNTSITFFDRFVFITVCVQCSLLYVIDWLIMCTLCSILCTDTQVYITFKIRVVKGIRWDNCTGTYRLYKTYSLLNCLGGSSACFGSIETSKISVCKRYQNMLPIKLFRLVFCLFRFNRNIKTLCFGIEAKQPKQTFCFG
jgi:hypothetical protein